MESGDLRVFQAVATEGSITKAANRLGYVQSNVTARIRQLEADLQTVLFHRHNRGMVLTAGGKSLLEYANQILGLLDEAAKAVTSAHEPRGPLSIGSSQTCAAVRLPKLLARYHRQYPEVALSLTTGNSDELTEGILRYELDGAFLSGPFDHDELAAIPMFEEEMVLVSEAGLEELEEAPAKPILVFAGGCYYRSALESWLKQNSWKSPQTMEFGTLEAILGGVSAGLGISLLPRTVVAKGVEEGYLRAHEFPEEARYVDTSFVWRKDAFLSRPLRLLMEQLASAAEPAADLFRA
ncbi:LysR substrate-binding domain-containing protein [Cohnella zeiphila]|uniref:LysR family transcriptional regulator n=1 Tax=Cohnella zeiphila TaxID=2761120 RepID=A0A7X0SQ58_9BACL|nr:LysR family transcriptional regulator [Cohnella zeiphila]